MAEDAWDRYMCKALLHWMKLSRATGSVQQAICTMKSLYCTSYHNEQGFALLCKLGLLFSDLTGITKIQRQCVKGRTKWIIIVEEEVVKWDQQPNGSLGPKTNRYEIIKDSNRSDMSKKNGMQKTGKIKAQYKVSN